MQKHIMCAVSDIVLENNSKVYEIYKDKLYGIYEIMDEEPLQNGYKYIIYKPRPDYEKDWPFYISKALFKSAFRPYTPKFVQFKRFTSIDSLNEFLAKLDKDNVKEVQDHNIYWTVLYLDGFDD